MSTTSDLHYVFVCQGKNCIAKGAGDMLIQIRTRLADNESFRVVPFICFGACAASPNIAVFPERLWYSTVSPEDVEQVVALIRRGEEMPELSGKVSADLKNLVFRLFGRPLRV
jgi:sirohydrochlorin cobaltochelatase